MTAARARAKRYTPVTDNSQDFVGTDGLTPENWRTEWDQNPIPPA